MSSVYGERGSAWLDALPGLLDETLGRWRLALERVHEPLGYGFVAYVREADGAPAVLKIGVDPVEIAQEAEYLRRLGPDVAVEVRRSEDRMTLLERAIPGDPLATYFPDRDREATLVFAGLTRKIAAAGEFPGDWDRLDDWMAKVRTCGEAQDVRASPIGPVMARAADLAFAMIAEGRPRAVLHGDLHHANIVRTARDWRLIDPKGVVGEIGFEAGALAHNPHPAFREHTAAPDIHEARVRCLAESLGEPAARIAAWTLIGSALEIAWDWEDFGEFVPDQVRTILMQERLLDALTPSQAPSA